MNQIYLHSGIIWIWFQRIDVLLAADSQQVISGKVEKGPFLKGSVITLFELDSNYYQTGRSFTSVIEDNQGSFTIDAVNLKGKIVNAQTDGFYLNEVFSENSDSRIVLEEIMRIDASQQTLNVNILTHIEKPGLINLLRSSAKHEDAQKQVVKELFSLFEWDTTNVRFSEQYALFDSLDENSVIAGISSLFVGFNKEYAIVERLTDFAVDFKLDGTIKNSNLMKSLNSLALLFNNEDIISNLSMFGDASILHFDLIWRIQSDSGFYDVTYLSFFILILMKGS